MRIYLDVYGKERVKQQVCSLLSFIGGKESGAEERQMIRPHQLAKMLMNISYGRAK